MENGILVEKKLNMDKDSTQASSSDQASSASASKNASSPAGKKQAAAARRKWHPHNIAEYLFFNDTGQLEVSEDSIR